MAISKDTLKNVQTILDQAQNKFEKLRQLKPYLMDASIRENSVGSSVGQILSDKLKMLPLLRDFGFEKIILGTLNYSTSDELEVDDDLMIYLRDHKVDLTGCFALTSIGILDSNNCFEVDPSLLKLQSYAVPNTIQEIFLAPEGMARLYDFETLKKSLPLSINWIHENIRGENGAKPRIFINIVDGFDAFVENPEIVYTILELLSKQPIEGLSFQDTRGTYLPFQVGAFIAIARSFLPAPLKLLVHVHGGAGFENASVIEALLNGADGAWGALIKNGPIVGHASLSELIASLVRVNNQHIQSYRLNQLLPLVRHLQELGKKSNIIYDLYMLGKEAFRLPLNVFRQRSGRFMDLAPEMIGGKYTCRICPTLSDVVVIAHRLSEVTGKPIAEFSDEVLDEMLRLMRRDLRAGSSIAYDEPNNLLQLYSRALDKHSASPS